MFYRHTELAARLDRGFRAARIHHLGAGIEDDQAAAQRHSNYKLLSSARVSGLN